MFITINAYLLKLNFVFELERDEIAGMGRPNRIAISRYAIILIILLIPNYIIFAHQLIFN